jgi:predicted nucleic acid-binding protein
MPAVIDSSALVAFSSVERLDIVQLVIGELWIPDAVFREVVTDGVGWTEAAQAQEEIAKRTWILRRSIRDTVIQAPLRNLGAGEREAVILARQYGLDLIMDDLKGRRSAVACGCSDRLTGSLGILMKAKRMGALSEIGSLIERIRKKGAHYSPALIQTCLKEVGEI